jgi:hypothetical protein
MVHAAGSRGGFHAIPGPFHYPLAYHHYGYAMPPATTPAVTTASAPACSAPTVAIIPTTYNTYRSSSFWPMSNYYYSYSSFNPYLYGMMGMGMGMGIPYGLNGYPYGPYPYGTDPYGNNLPYGAQAYGTDPYGYNAQGSADPNGYVSPYGNGYQGSGSVYAPGQQAAAEAANTPADLQNPDSLPFDPRLVSSQYPPRYAPLDDQTGANEGGNDEQAQPSSESSPAGSASEPNQMAAEDSGKLSDSQNGSSEPGGAETLSAAPPASHFHMYSQPQGLYYPQNTLAFTKPCLLADYMWLQNRNRSVQNATNTQPKSIAPQVAVAKPASKPVQHAGKRKRNHAPVKMLASKKNAGTQSQRKFASVESATITAKAAAKPIPSALAN